MAQQKTVMVTGPNGFIGEELVEQLHDQGYRVIAVCRTGKLCERIHSIVDAVEEVDFADDQAAQPTFWEHIINRHGVDAIVNAAAVITGSDEHFNKVNTWAPTALFQAADDVSHARGKPIRIVQLSTAEAHSPYAHEQPYTRTKKATAEYLENLKDVESFTLGINIVYDTAEHAGSDPRAMLFELLARSPVPAFPRAGKYDVQPIYRPDIARGIIGLLRDETYPQTPDGERTHSEVIPVMGPKQMTMADIVNVIRRAHGQHDAKLWDVPLWAARLGGSMAERVVPVMNRQFVELAEMTRRPHGGATGSPDRFIEAAGLEGLVTMEQVYGLSELPAYAQRDHSAPRGCRG